VFQKTCDVFDDKMNYNSPFTKLFGTLWSHFWDTVYNLYS